MFTKNTHQSSLPSLRCARVSSQPAFAFCLFIGLLVGLATTSAFAQSRAAQFRQLEIEQARAQRLRAEVPNRPFSIARGEAPAESSFVQSVKETIKATGQEALAAIFGPPTTPKWNQLAGPEAGVIPALFEKNGRVFAGTYGGIYYSDDQGQTWTRSFGSQAIITSNRIVSLGDAIFYGADANSAAQENLGGIRRSTDNGLTWEHLNNGLPARSYVNHLTVWKNTLLATLYGGGTGFTVYRSADNGDSWQEASNGLPTDLFYINSTSNDRAVLATSGAGLHRTLDGGSTWEAISQNLPAGVQLVPNQFVVLHGKSFIVWAGKSGVLMSDDDGTTWRFANQGLPADAFVGDVAIGGTDLFATLADGSLYRSMDGGANWSKRHDEFGFGKSIRSWLKVGSTNLVGTGDGVYRSEDDGATWDRSNAGMRNAYNDGGFLIVGKRLYVSTAGGVWMSDTKGASWTLMNNGWRKRALTSIQGVAIGIKDGILFANSDGDGLYRSADGGGSWERLSNGLPEAFSTFIVKVFNGKIYVNDAFGDGDIYVSSDNGDTWAKIKSFQPGIVFTMASLGGGRLLLGSYGKGVFRSDDDGATWQEFNTGIQDKRIDDFNIYRSIVLVGTDDGIYRMADDESGWVYQPYYAENIKGGITYFCQVGKALYASSFGRGVSVSYNNGASWGPFNNGLSTERGFYMLEMEGDLYFGSAGAGMWVLRAPVVIKPPIIVPPPDDPLDDLSNDN